MSPAAGYPATGQSWVAPVGDTCRLVKLRFRFPGMIFMDVQAPVATELPVKSSPRAFPVAPLGSWCWEASNTDDTIHSNRPGQPPRSRVSGPKGAPPRGLSRYAPHIHVPQGVLPMNRDHFHPYPRADPVHRISDLRSAQHMSLVPTFRMSF